MPVRCVFFVPGQPQPCQVLEALGTPALSGRTQQGLERRYCRCGTFVSCPIFQRVEQRLVQYDEHVREPAVA